MKCSYKSISGLFVYVKIHSSKWTEKHNHFRIGSMNTCEVHELYVRGEQGGEDSFSLLVATTSVSSLSKFQFSGTVLKPWLCYSSAGMLLPSSPLKSMGYTLVPSRDLCFRIHGLWKQTRFSGDTSLFFWSCELWSISNVWGCSDLGDWTELVGHAASAQNSVKAWEVYVGQLSLPSNWGSWPCLEYVM